MKNKLTVITATVLAVAAIALGAIVIYKQFNISDVVDTDSGDGGNPTAPDFTVYDKDGAAVSLSDFVGKPVVLNFWASWCGPCKNEMPDFDEVYKQYGDDVVFLMVNITDGTNETVDSASSFIQSAGYTFPVYYDTELAAVSVYGVSSIPMTFFIDANGDVAAYHTGTMSKDLLLSGINMIYSE